MKLRRRRATRLRAVKATVKRVLRPALGTNGFPLGSEYSAWVGGHRPRASVSHDADAPTIAILMAVHNPPPQFLVEAIDSVRTQTSSDWELILSDDGTVDRRDLEIVERAVTSDARIRRIRCETSQGIVSALNAALNESRAIFVGVLDHDDLLHPRAVEMVVEEIRSRPNSDLIYSDEDKVTEDGEHFDPFFKPDFSPELLVSNMYLNHFTAMRRSSVESVGAFRLGTDGAQDHDLALRMVRTGASVTHLHGVLYHWRAWSGSTASGIQAKPWAQEAAQRVQSAHIESLGYQPKVTPSDVPGLNEVRLGIRGDPKVSIIIPTASKRAAIPGGPPTYVEQCLRSIRRMGGWDNTEIIVVHTGPIEGRQARLFRDFQALVVPYPHPEFNFSEAVNLGVEAASGDFLLLLNDDTEPVRPGPVRAMLELAQLDGVGAVGARLTYPDGRNQHSGILMIDGMPTHPHHGASARSFGYFGSIITPRNFLAVTGAALMTPTALYRELDGLDPLWPRDFQDVDYCLRLIDRGLRIAYTPYAHLTHHEGVSLNRSEADPVDRARFRAKWAGRVTRDPFYSPLLSQSLSELHEPL